MGIQETPQIVFTITEEDGTVFRDALTFNSMQELRNTSAEERGEMIQERYDNWLEIINTPPPEEEAQTEEEV